MKQRIHILDELRGFCVVLMVIYHGLFTLAMMFGQVWALTLLKACTPLEPIFAGVFIALCGFSCRLSKNNWKRGLLLAAVAVGMSLVMMFFSPIWFGVLHCLAVCILLFAATRPLLDRVPTLVGVVACAFLFGITYTVPLVFGGEFLGMPLPETLLECKWLFPFGFGRIYTADYFPLIPWVFCFLGGTFLAKKRAFLPAWCMKPHIKPLAFLGRHSLWVYLVHQPIIVGVTILVMLVF